MFTGRDAVHAYLMKNAPPVDLRGSVLYHCGPVMLKQGDEWAVKAAGPTTSSREEPYQATIIEQYGVRAVIGKGGMGAKTLAALEESRRGVSERHRRRGAVLRAHGGEGAGRASDRVRHSRSDVASACENFAAIVTMDAHGNSLHADVERVTGPSSRNCSRSERAALANPLHFRIARPARARDESSTRYRQNLLPIRSPKWAPGPHVLRVCSR